MTKIVLVSNTQIIKQIFTLVSNNLQVNLEILEDISVLDNPDVLILDEEFINLDLKNIDRQCTKVAFLYQNQKNNTNNTFDFDIKKPFLPSSLLQTLTAVLTPKSFPKSAFDTITKVDTISTIDTVTMGDINHRTVESNDSITEIQNNLKNFESYERDENEEFGNKDTIDNLLNFIDNLDEGSAADSCVELPENDCSLVSEEEMGQGGVLDLKELSLLNTMINNGSENDTNNTIKKDDWLELSSIIDDAIDEVQEYEFSNDLPISLKLNEYTIDELSPLLKKLNQSIIDKLTSGNKINLELSFEDK
jgi:hypothetical protein